MDWSLHAWLPIVHRPPLDGWSSRLRGVVTRHASDAVSVPTHRCAETRRGRHVIGVITEEREKVEKGEDSDNDDDDDDVNVIVRTKKLMITLS